MIGHFLGWFVGKPVDSPTTLFILAIIFSLSNTFLHFFTMFIQLVGQVFLSLAFYGVFYYILWNNGDITDLLLMKE